MNSVVALEKERMVELEQKSKMTDTANDVLGCGKDRPHGKAKYLQKYNHHIIH